MAQAPEGLAVIVRRLIRWLLERVDADDIFWTVHRRGWVPIPKAWAEFYMPEENLKTGWWPHPAPRKTYVVRGEDFTSENFAPVDHDDKH